MVRDFIYEAAPARVVAFGAPVSLRNLGMPADGIGRAAEEVLAGPCWNPRPLEMAGLTHLLERAWSGAEPPSS